MIVPSGNPVVATVRRSVSLYFILLPRCHWQWHGVAKVIVNSGIEYSSSEKASWHRQLNIMTEKSAGALGVDWKDVLQQSLILVLDVFAPFHVIIEMVSFWGSERGRILIQSDRRSTSCINDLLVQPQAGQSASQIDRDRNETA